VNGLVELLFGSGTELNVLQMTDRSIAVFFLTLAMIRMAGRRSFGQQRPFDACTMVLLGSILSRAVVGASPFGPTVMAGLAIVLLHRLLGLASCMWPGFETLVSGDKRELIKQGRRDLEQMRKGLITQRDLDEALRSHGVGEDTVVERAVLERDGEVSVLRHKHPSPADGPASS